MYLELDDLGMGDQAQTEPLFDGPGFVAPRAGPLMPVMSPAAQACVRDRMPVFVCKGAGQLCISGHRVRPPTAQAEAVADAVQAIRAILQAAARTHAMPPEGGRWHGARRSPLQRVRRIP